MPWQQLVADVGGELLPSGLPAYREVVVTVMRQSGKTTLFLTWSVDRCNLWGSRQAVAYTAQTGSDARQKMLEDWVPAIERSAWASKLKSVHRAQGGEAITWNNGSRIGVHASSTSAGHGKTRHLGLIDEAFDDVDDRREGAIAPSQITVRDAQLLICSTMGTDASLYLNRKVDVGRAAAMEGRTSGIAYFEWSVPEDEDVDDPEVWWRFMPALGWTIDDSTVAHLRSTMSDGEFRRAICNQRMRSDEWMIPKVTWARVCRDADVSPMGVDRPTFAVEVSPDRDFAAICAAGNVGGRLVGELVEHRPGVGWLLERVVELREKYDARIVIEDRSPAAAVKGLADTVDDVLDLSDAVKASGWFYDQVADDKLSVRPDAAFDRALAVAVKKPAGELGWRFDRKPGGDVSPLVALTLALWDADQASFFIY